MKEELEVLVDKGFATALKFECTSGSESEGSQNPSLYKNLTNGGLPLAPQNKQRTVVVKERRRKMSEGDINKIKGGNYCRNRFEGEEINTREMKKKNRDDDQFPY